VLVWVRAGRRPLLSADWCADKQLAGL